MNKHGNALAFGVRTRLMLAFVCISTFSMMAAASGLYSLSQVGGSLDRITQDRVPEAMAWLELARKAERVVRAAPALLIVNSEADRAEVSRTITEQVAQLDPDLGRQTNLELYEEGRVDRVKFLIERIKINLVALDQLVEKRLAIVDRRDKQLRKLARASSTGNRTLAPGARILGSQLAGWERKSASDGATFAKSDEQFAMAESIVELIPQQHATVLIDKIHNQLLNITAAGSGESIDVLIIPLKKSVAELSLLAANMPIAVKRRLDKQLKVFQSLIDGSDSLSQIRKDELLVITKAEGVLVANVTLSKSLTGKVNYLVNVANEAISQANLQAADVQSLNRNVLIGVVGMSLLSSVLIVWLYVGRNLIARLTALSDSMLAIAKGDLRAPLPKPGGSDEISEMAKALIVFRDTAIEVEKSNLREIEEARRRLVDAIENSSEGFAFYDAKDNLVICNSRYRDLLYPDVEFPIEPGMPFEKIIRMAAEGGHISDAEGRVDEWVMERLATHESPGEPRIQQRKEGQWLLVTERKTGDGGTVAVYSDITDLKQREQDLTTKSNALQQLSNQLAKYLSPQVYDSIFSGRQEVILASQRKRLTVFFSDLVGFTATTERLESEDLTRLLNQYLTEMSEIALAHGATIDKYIGDAIVIFFGDPDTLGVKEDAIACVTMAIAMRKRMRELETLWREAGLENPLQCRMGINTGVCTVGNFGSNDRMDYTIIGGGVNLAARLETACKPNEILISYETFAHVKELVHCEVRDEISVKGIARPVSTFQVNDLYGNLGDGNAPIRAKLPHFQLDVDVTSMTSGEKKEALAVLLDSVERLSKLDRL